MKVSDINEKDWTYLIIFLAIMSFLIPLIILLALGIDPLEPVPDSWSYDPFLWDWEYYSFCLGF